MANRITPDKAKSIAVEYILTQGNKSQALINCGYHESYAKSGRGLQIYDNVIVISEIKRLQAKQELKSDISIQSIQKEHEEYQRLAIEKGDIAAATSNLIAKGKTIAAYADKLQTTQDKATAIPANELEALEVAAKQAALKIAQG